MLIVSTRIIMLSPTAMSSGYSRDLTKITATIDLNLVKIVLSFF
jgi:hypothetical protein